MLSVDSLLILTMRSSCLSPARPAGVSGIGFMTVSCWSRIEMTMPRPPNWPCVERFISLYASGESSTECGSSVWSMPLHAAYSTSRRSTSVPRRPSCRNAKTSRRWELTSQGPCTLSTRNFFSCGVDADLAPRGVVLVVDDDDLRHVLLDVVERREEHLLRLDALRDRRTGRGSVLSTSLTTLSCVRS